MNTTLAGRTAADRAVLLDVLELLRNVDRAASRRVTADSADGRVTLRGNVPTYYTRQVLVQSCRRIPGVMEVVDELRVEK